MARNLRPTKTKVFSIVGITCYFKGEPSPQIRTESVARHLCRIAQEALFNAVKHSHSKAFIVGRL